VIGDLGSVQTTAGSGPVQALEGKELWDEYEKVKRVMIFRRGPN